MSGRSAGEAADKQTELELRRRQLDILGKLNESIKALDKTFKRFGNYMPELTVSEVEIGSIESRRDGMDE